MSFLSSRIRQQTDQNEHSNLPDQSASTIIKDALRIEVAEKEEISERVSGLLSLKPSPEENRESDRIIRKVSALFGVRISEEGITDKLKIDIATVVGEEAKRVCDSFEAQERLKKLVFSNMFGLGPIESYMQPGSSVSDIVVLRYDRIFIEDDSGLHLVDAQFASEQQLVNVIERIIQQAGRQINLITPAVDAKLDDGSRVHATIPPVTPDGATLTIRRFNNRKLDHEDYISLGTASEDMMEFLRFAVQSRLNILVSGGTGSGKTTLLNLLSSYIPDNELIVTIEDNCELQLRQPNVRRMESRFSTAESATNITIQDLVRHSLRMRPDRIIVGEARDGCIVDMLSAMSTGHEGSMSTIHSDSPQALFDSRLPTLFSQYNVNFSKETQALMCSEAIHLVVQISRERDFTRKITHIASVEGIDPATNQIVLQDIFSYSRASGSFEVNPIKPKRLFALLREKGIGIPKRIRHLYEKGGQK